MSCFAHLSITRTCAAQFYLGTTRLQLEHKGDSAHVVTDIANIVPAFGFVGIPIIGWLLDKQARALPPRLLAGRPCMCAACSIALHASPRAASGSRALQPAGMLPP